MPTTPSSLVPSPIQLTPANPSAAAVEPIQAFDLAFDAEVRSDVDAASNHEDVRFQFLDAAGGCLLAQFERSGRLSLRGPKGDYLYDGKTWSRLTGASVSRPTARGTGWRGLS